MNWIDTISLQESLLLSVFVGLVALLVLLHYSERARSYKLQQKRERLGLSVQSIEKQLNQHTEHPRSHESTSETWIGRAVQSQYVIKSEIGSGAYFRVYKAWDTERKDYVALKIHTSDPGATDVVINYEMNLYQKHVKPDCPSISSPLAFGTVEACDRQHVGQHVDTGDIPHVETSHTYVVMPLGVDLRRIISAFGPLPEGCIRLIARDVLLGLSELVACGFSHHDVKPGNILLLETGRCTLSDLNACFPLVGTKDRYDPDLDAPATVSWSSPESRLQQPYDLERADIWSCGASVFFGLFGCRPPDQDIDQFVSRESAVGEPLSAECVEFMRCALHSRPECRAAAADLHRHCWFSSSSFEKEEAFYRFILVAVWCALF